jgi:hypothetical protein
MGKNLLARSILTLFSTHGDRIGDLSVPQQALPRISKNRLIALHKIYSQDMMQIQANRQFDYFS